MKLTKQQEAEIMPIYEEWWHSYLNGDVKTYDHYLDKDYRFVGSTVAEDFLNKVDTTQFFDATADQLSGKIQKRNSKLTAEYYDGIVFITELTDAYLLFGDEWTFYGKFRLSSMLRNTSVGWRFIYQHFSVPDSKAHEGETIGFEQVSKENQELRDAIKRRTTELENKNRELEIETALERVRSASMAMHSSEELASVARTVFEQLRVLDIDVYRSWIDIFHVEEGYVLTWSTDFEGNFQSNPATFPLDFDETMSDFYRDFKSSSQFIELEAHGDEVKEWFDYLYSASSDPIFKISDVPNDLYQIWAKHQYGTIATTKLSPITEGEKDVLNKFAKVFEQSYTRFLDLQKAEKQAREAQIEVAVERVRAKALAMHKSSEILQVAITLKEQMEELNLSGITAATIYLEHDDNKIRVWDITELKETENGPQLSSDFTFRLEDTDPGLWVRRVWNAREKYSVIEMSGDDFIKCEKWIREFDETTADNYWEFIKAAKIEHTWHPTVQLEKGKLNLDFTVPPPLEMEFILPKMGAAFDLAYRRFLDLQKAEAQAREAQIEASLERVRAKAMSMQNSDELDEVLSVLCEQFDVLGIFPMSTHMTVFNFENNTFTFRETGKYGDRSFGEQTVDLDAMDTWKDTVDKWKADKATAINRLHFPNETLPEVWEVFHESFASMPDDSRITPEDYPDGIYHTAGKHPFGYIGMNQVRPATKEEEQIVIKFANEFGRAYQRFLDLQKAEQQAREAQIETALEKVRSRTMAMQSSDELTEASTEMFSQIKGLGLDPWSCGFNIFNDDKTVISQWVSSGDGRPIKPFDTPTDKYIFKRIVEHSAKDEPLYIEKMEGKKLEDTYKYMASLPTLDKIFEELDAADIALPKKQVDHAAYFKHGYLMFITYDEVPEFHSIFTRFAKVFEQTYTRFLDLQKAEEQTREAKIEAALEKVRSRSMGMQSSEELPEVANLMFLEVQALGINAWSCGYCILEEDRRSSICIMSSEGTIQKPFLLPHIGEPSFEEWDDFVHSDESFFVQELKGQAIESHYDFMTSLPQVKPIFQEMIDAGLSLPTYQINHLCKFSDGFLLFITYEEVSEHHDIFKRFTSVFDQTYTRFLDLQKSERRAREAEIELALERVRAQVTAMQKSSDLFDIVVNMRKEFISLGHKADYFWHMRWMPDSYEMSMTSEDGNRIGMVIRIPKFVHDGIPGLAKWEKSSDPVYVMPLSADDAWDYIENMNTHGQYEQADPNAPTKNDIQEIGGLTFIIARTSHGEIGYSLPGEVPDPPKEALVTLKRFAGVFDLAYQRFEDLQAAEQQARLVLEERDRLEVALNELHATQDQLVQQEKLASLGQLTAGIAHEIKNPLNFVNNFSDVSIELVEEAREELSAFRRQLTERDELDCKMSVVRRETSNVKRDTEESLFEGGKDGEAGQGDEAESTRAQNLSTTLEILDDIESNLRKIHEHGSRADSIVKSMLQHSRGGDGKPEPTPLNPLIKEYVNLAYHGMRAGADPIDVEIDLSLDESIGDVNLIAEDFSRVILNICNNGFDALREKLTADSYQLSANKSPFEGGKNGEAGQGDDTAPSYNPKLIIRTRKSDNSVTIDIEDNGPGIPEEIIDKILQPFFTTKKGTLGTGLGLSITNDIIKAHGGRMDIDSVPGESTTFSIHLEKREN